jgi:hypothetical protein
MFSSRSFSNACPKVKEAQGWSRANGHLHGADNPTYLKKSGDSAVTYACLAVSGIATALIFRGMAHMAHGTNKN